LLHAGSTGLPALHDFRTGINGNIRAGLKPGSLFLKKVTVIWALQGSGELISSRGGGWPCPIRFKRETSAAGCFFLETAAPIAAKGQS
jgi:hypothetical protein